MRSNQHTVLAIVLSSLAATSCSEPVLTQSNDPPLAVIRSPSDGDVFDEGEPVALRGEVTDDKSISGLDVEWLDNGTPLGTGEATVDDEGNTELTVADLALGSHAISLRVVDADNLSFEASVTIDVVEAIVDPTLTILHPENGEKGEVGTDFVFEVEVSDPNSPPDDLDVEVSSDLDGFLCTFEIDTQGLGLCRAAPASDGDHRLTFTATDPEGNSRSRTTVWTVEPVPEEPTIAIVAPVGGASLREGVTLSFEATVSDRQDDANTLLVTVTSDVDGLICQPIADATGSATCLGALLTPGPHRLTYEVTDSDTNTSSAQVLVQVTDGDDVDDDGDGYTENQGDCDDSSTGGMVYPGATERPNGQDDNCNDVADEGTALYDDDGDGFCEGPTCTDGTTPGDCNDTQGSGAAINPDADEVCGNSIDENCDQQTNEDDAVGCSPYFRDNDEDSYGDPDVPVCACAPRLGISTNDDDCDDSTEDFAPGVAEIPDGLDQDCDDVIDEGTVRYDDDGDGYCEGPLCSDGTTPGDCNDDPTTGGAINPGAPEVCGSGLDDNCAAGQDEDGAQGCSPYFRDNDEDSYGDPDVPVCACAPRLGISTNDDDCDDSTAAFAPNVAEEPDGQDQDCDDVIDEGTVRYDDDGDGYCEGPICSDGTTPGDCNDDPTTGGAINPGALEVCGNGIDDNCAAGQDEEGAQGCTPYYFDNDNDGFGDPDNSRCACNPIAGAWTTDNRDCDDSALGGNINPNATEQPNGIDDNCNEIADEGTVRYDDDGDGYCEGPVCTDGTTPGDCDDVSGNAGNINPGVREICGNAVDEDCSGNTNDGFDDAITGGDEYFQDADFDGFGAQGVSRRYCQPTGTFTASTGTDCFDGNAFAYPGPRQPGDPTWFTDDRGDGSYDFNCNNVEDERFTDDGFECGCTVQGAGISVPIFQFEEGWDGVPACGQQGDYVTACEQVVVDLGITDPIAALFFGLVQCFADIDELDVAVVQSRTQECR